MQKQERYASTVSADGTSIRYTDEGEGGTILIVRPGSTGASSWRAVARQPDPRPSYFAGAMLSS